MQEAVIAHPVHCAKRALLCAFAALVAAAVLSGCGAKARASSAPHAASAPQRPVVFAASSLTTVLPVIDSTARYQFAGSDELAAQLREGAPSDVFVAANSAIPRALYKAGIVERPVPFATNRVVLIVPRSSAIHSLADLVTARHARIVMGDAGVPIGLYTRTVLKQLGDGALVHRAASFEHDVKAVNAKIVLGAADAGFVYITDATADDAHVRVIELPPASSNSVTYMAAVVRHAKHHQAAATFLRKLTSAAGRKALQHAGFGVPSQ